MGMYDYLRCDRQLEDGRVIEGQDWQTKDGPCELGLLVITPDGHLTFDGVVCSRSEEYSAIVSNYHGEVRFYSRAEEYSAIFVDGTCIHLSQRE